MGVLRNIVEATILMPTDDDRRPPCARFAGRYRGGHHRAFGRLLGPGPVSRGFSPGVREATTRRGVVLIFDEVISGFRFSAGGAQGLWRYRRPVHDGQDRRRRPARRRAGRPTRHHGNARLCRGQAANGNASLIRAPTTRTRSPPLLQSLRCRSVATDACAKASGATAKLRAGMNDVLQREALQWVVYGDFSLFHVFTNPNGLDIGPGRFDPLAVGFDGLKKAKSASQANELRLALLARAWTSWARRVALCLLPMGRARLRRTLEAFRTSRALAQGGGRRVGECRGAPAPG